MTSSRSSRMAESRLFIQVTTGIPKRRVWIDPADILQTTRVTLPSGQIVQVLPENIRSIPL